MSKRILIIFVVLFSIILSGCNDAQYINFKKKPNKFYYTEELYKIVSSKDFTLSAFDTNVYREENPKGKDKDIVINFIKCLSKDNFIDKPSNLPEKPVYKLFISSSETKFVINIYENNIVSIFPWDGMFSEDFINTENIPQAYKLYLFCKYVFKQ
ncbi:hypothetical protein CPJCM30710_22610 [Clostridium polyendosporum]|uniref:Lipoprotein n=1 Tax=Clostridium polyendosporum TaxID=69208 RepID=A0A919VGP6_9CLOT|nr:DUF4883 family protein [Clostridium polyendosporum]GIM29595.1 hypothetical protein CPJCM30710_22610 [Clostridium polyendosporum]